MISSWLSIKIPEITGSDFSFPISWPILDIPIKIEAVSWDVKLRVESLLVFDGISLRKLQIADARNMLTITWIWKVSIQGKEDIISVLWSEARDAALDVWGIWFMKPVYNMLRFWAKKLGIGSNADEISQFIATLSQKREKVGKSHFSIAKWSKYIPQWDESSFWISGGEVQWSCILRVNTLLELKDVEARRIVSRTNIPLFWLSRDHARPVSIRALTNVFSHHDGQEEKFDSHLELGPIQYRTLISGD